MKHTARVWTLVLAAALPFVVACDFDFDPFLNMASAEATFERTLSVSGSLDIDVNTGSGNISVRPGNAGAVRVVGRIKARDDSEQGAEEKARYIAANPPIEQTGGIIRIGRIDKAEYRRNVSISYEIEAPAETRLEAKSGSGNLDVEGLRGALELSTGSGNIKLDSLGDEVHAETGSGNIDAVSLGRGLRASTGSGSIHATQVGGSVKAGTGSGNISVEMVAEGDAELETGSGEITASGIQGGLRAETGSGSVRLSGTPTRPWEASTGSGGLHLQLDGKVGFDLDAHADSGSVNLHQTLSSTETVTKHVVRGKVGGGGALVKLRSGSGDIAIE
jgi:DUF4097 and DUF4098 domain-containing protein YvlB